VTIPYHKQKICNYISQTDDLLSESQQEWLDTLLKTKKSTGFFLRKHWKWPFTPYKARWQRVFNQQEAMQSLKQSATKPPLLENPGKSHLLSSLNYFFSIYNVEPTPKVYDFILKTSFKPFNSITFLQFLTILKKLKILNHLNLFLLIL